MNNKKNIKLNEENELNEENLGSVSGGVRGGISGSNPIVKNSDGTWSAKVNKNGKYQYVNIGNQSSYQGAQNYAKSNLWDI